MAQRIRAHPWADTPLGAIEDWPQSLRFAINIALGSSFPTAIYWGPELRLLYNDAWAPIPADRHPWALGRPGAEVWADIWHLVGDEMARVLATGEGFSTYDQMLPMVRDGRRQETWWNYSFTPIRDEHGDVVGILNQGNETTRAVLGERARLAEVERLRELFEQAPGAVALLHGPDHVFEIVNPAYRDLIGGREVLGLAVAEGLPEVVEQGFVELLDQVFRTGVAYRADAVPIHLLRGDDAVAEARMLDFVYQPIKDATGDTTDILVFANDVTERATAEAALRTNEERLQLALDSSVGVGTWFWDVPNDRVTADRRFLRLYGVDEAREGVGAPIEAFFVHVHPDDRAKLEAAIAASLATGAGFSEEYRLVQPDGTIHWVAAQGKPIFDDLGQPLRFPGVSFDITERKAAEEAARAAAADLGAANALQSFVYALAETQRRLDTPDAIMAATSEAMVDQLGADRVGFYRVTEGETIVFGASATRGTLPPLAGTIAVDGIGAAVQQAYRAGETLVLHDTRRQLSPGESDIAQRAEAAIGVPLLRGGEWIATMFVNQAAPRRWSPEEVAFTEAIAEMSWDAVERAGALVALRGSEEKFRAIANSIDPMVWSTLPDGYHDYYNDRWYEFTGTPYGSTDGEGWADMFHPDDQGQAWKLWRHCLETGEPYHIEYRLRHHSGRYRWVLGRAQPVRDESGRIIRWFGTCTDIQEIVDAREVLARSREELEAAIHERTEQLMLAEQQLRQAQKMEAVGQLTGGIAHDFNNMLAVVIGALDLLERRIAQGRTDVDRYLVAARDGATRAAALTQRLLAFSRQQPLAPSPVDANAMVEGMIELLMRTLGEAIGVETLLAGSLRPALADPNQLENAILNLSVNARDAMPGGGRLTIETANLAAGPSDAQALGIEPGDYVAITVADTGVGMPPEIAARAFDPFFTTKGVGKGTGLGLSQVFGFARQSGGAVRIETAPGEGTRVSLYLPVYHGAIDPVAQAGEVAEAERARPGELVMVVEDEERVRSYSIEALRELGYEVVSAPDGIEALRMIERGQRVSLLFTDVVMPEMSGRELARRARDRLPGLKVLLTSGYTPDIAGFDETILTKPFGIDRLAHRVRAALDE
ncbi:PAS domain-containing protein [Sphingomonas sp. HF-S4]|uniref:histidine kinase n=1 Tax=Sphingomonas agrestis TaxID=3080540 RepID=A0ABU3YCQ2_9SPHN|nr:PAS domain-containing protein [Sphingomonas sp. HF-S4]MDV3459104.1 PAS domain-containing protein [Sphingomonas sp. HF-S4]